jgi:hypothetical protein
LLKCQESCLRKGGNGLTQGTIHRRNSLFSGEERAMLDKTWQVSYASVSIACKTENDAKLLARQLMKKDYRVRAETLEGQNPMRVIEPHQVAAWLLE